MGSPTLTPTLTADDLDTLHDACDALHANRRDSFGNCWYCAAPGCPDRYADHDPSCAMRRLDALRAKVELARPDAVAGDTGQIACGGCGRDILPGTTCGCGIDVPDRCPDCGADARSMRIDPDYVRCACGAVLARTQTPEEVAAITARNKRWLAETTERINTPRPPAVARERAAAAIVATVVP